jgi:hypothetical protein
VKACSFRFVSGVEFLFEVNGKLVEKNRLSVVPFHQQLQEESFGKADECNQLNNTERHLMIRMKVFG